MMRLSRRPQAEQREACVCTAQNWSYPVSPTGITFGSHTCRSLKTPGSSTGTDPATCGWCTGKLCLGVACVWGVLGHNISREGRRTELTPTSWIDGIAVKELKLSHHNMANR